MKKVQKLQFFLAVIPYISTPVILVLSIISLKRNQASFKKWVYFYLILFSSVFGIGAIHEIMANREQAFVKFIVTALILTTVNILLIILQVTSSSPNKVPAKEQTSPAARPFPWKVLTIVISVVILAFISFFVLLKQMPDLFVDSNGAEDTSLTTITLEELLSPNQTGSHWSVSTGESGDQTNVTGILRANDYDRTHISCRRTDGVSVLQATNIDSDALTLNIDSTVTRGNLEIIIMIEDEYYCYVPVNSVQCISLNNVSGKTVLVKMGAEGAEIDITVTREY